VCVWVGGWVCVCVVGGCAPLSLLVRLCVKLSLQDMQTIVP